MHNRVNTLRRSYRSQTFFAGSVGQLLTFSPVVSVFICFWHRVGTLTNLIVRSNEPIRLSAHFGNVDEALKVFVF